MFRKVFRQYPFEFLILFDLCREKKMLAKELMCECFYQIFQSEGGSYEKKYPHLHCGCKEKHVLYVLFCDWHSYGSDSNQEMTGQKCSCAVLTRDEICGFYIHVRYILNFRCLKLCVKKIPKFWQILFKQHLSIFLK